MSLAGRLEDQLTKFEDATDGVLGTSVISRSQALMLVGTSKEFDKDIIQGMSVKLLRLANETLDQLNYSNLESLKLKEENYNISIHTINSDYYIVVISNKSELSGLHMTNLEELVGRVKRIIES